MYLYKEQKRMQSKRVSARKISSGGVRNRNNQENDELLDDKN